MWLQNIPYPTNDVPKIAWITDCFLVASYTNSFPLDTVLLAYCQMQRNRNKHMNMILRYMAIDNPHLMLLADTTEQLPNTLCNETTQYTLTVFCDPYNMILTIITYYNSSYDNFAYYDFETQRYKIY